MTISKAKSDEEISMCIKAAIEKIDRVEEDAEKKKTEIVQDLAKDLEGKIATDSISNEIVHQLRCKISETLIRRCLDEKYKEKHRVANARKQKKKDESTKDLAASVPLNNGDIDPQEKKKIIIDTSGNEIGSPEPSVNDYDRKEILAQSNPIDATNCEQCEIKDTKIRELNSVQPDMCLFQFLPLMAEPWCFGCNVKVMVLVYIARQATNRLHGMHSSFLNTISSFLFFIMTTSEKTSIESDILTISLKILEGTWKASFIHSLIQWQIGDFQNLLN
ncbi:MAG: hypothetical protein WAM14_04730 [Candidatus Nitrosopolaris sp.]